MNTAFKSILVGGILATGIGGLALAADAPDNVIGTWTLDVGRSRFTPGPAPMSQTRVYADTTDGIVLTINGVAANGTAMSQHSTFRYDGKAYPFAGSMDFDTLSLQRVDGSTVKSQMMRAGKAVGDTTRTVSKDGKVLTVDSKGTDAKGQNYSSVAVYDRQ
jgi:hypothetical protein